MKKIIFILTYSEGDRWAHYYKLNEYQKYFPNDEYQLIILDNGNQDVVKEWAKKANAIYHRSENNIGTTGGYNWFFRIGQLLKAPRIAVLQADVFVHNPLAISYLFNKIDGSEWDKQDFVYWPNTGKSTWDKNHLSSDVGQFFSVDPNFFIENDYMCDENYTVTHFESIDLWCRMTSTKNRFPAKPRNLLHLYFPNEDLTFDDNDTHMCSVYSYHSFSNHSGEHDEWFAYNWEYFKKKWVKPSFDIDSDAGYKMLTHGFNVWSGMPWTTTPGLQQWEPLLLHRKPLDPFRNINVNQMPYPVEYEVNKFYTNFIKAKDSTTAEIKESSHLEGIDNFETSILIIGSSGYIGNSLTKHLHDLQYLVTTVDSNMFGGPKPHYKTDYKLLDKEFYSKFSHIILLAGHSSMAMCSDNYQDAWDNNVTKFADLISKLSEKQTLIYASSGSVYGQGGENRKEYMTLATAQIEYDLTKQMIEKLALGAKCKTVGLRFGTVNGYSEYSRSDLMLNAMVINSKSRGSLDCYNGVNHRSILGINDCVRAIKEIVDKTRSPNNTIEHHEIFNLSSVNGSISSFAEKAGSILKVPVTYHPEITNLFSFELDSSKFINTFNFTFKDTIDSILTELVEKYNAIIWSKRVSTPIETQNIATEITIKQPAVSTTTYSEVKVEPEIISVDDNADGFGVLFDTTVAEPAPSFRSLVAQPANLGKSTYKKLYSCLCCNNPHLFVILDLENQPLANSFHKPEEGLEDYELKLMGCDSCWHTQLSIAVDPDILFKNYIYVSGTSKMLKEYFDWFADQYSKFTREGGRVLDIACNDGSQLDSFKDRGWITFGVDPAENLHKISTDKGHHVICDYWSVAVANKLPKFDIIIAQNVFAHTSNIDEFLEACTKVMHPGTMLVIQTSQAEMFEKNQFDTIYHEHISYFSIKSMKEAVERAGLFLNHVFKPNVHGMSYSFTINKRDQHSTQVDDEIEKEKFKYNREFYDTYRNNALKCLSDLKSSLDSKTAKVVGYGAAAKGMTVINAGKLKLDYIVDDNPLKQGLLCPGSNIPVKNSQALKEEQEDLIIVPLAWNFYDEIYNKVKFLRPNNNDTFIKYFPNLHELK
jgi:nucleoside-diphosphate-sugar epimerase/ubiquinone/menaquinone biosynthesis C-methylase UbiE